jgi:hypothetical protein
MYDVQVGNMFHDDVTVDIVNDVELGKDVKEVRVIVSGHSGYHMSKLGDMSPFTSIRFPVEMLDNIVEALCQTKEQLHLNDKPKEG